MSKIDDHGWTVRAEPVPPEEEVVSEEERMLHVYHFHFDGDRKQVPAGVGSGHIHPMFRSTQGLGLAQAALVPIL